MSDTSQIALIRKLYAAMGDVNSFKSLLANDAVWDIEEAVSYTHLTLPTTERV